MIEMDLYTSYPAYSAHHPNGLWHIADLRCSLLHALNLLSDLFFPAFNQKMADFVPIRPDSYIFNRIVIGTTKKGRFDLAPNKQIFDL